jgi:hypothetical protein
MRALIFVLASAFALAAFAFDVTTDYNHRVSFANYHTYSWIGVQAGNDLWQDRIRAAIDNQLAEKGWQRLPNGGDAAVSAFGKTREDQAIQTFYNGFPGWGWGGGDGFATTYSVPDKTGSLTVDIFDGNTRRLIWRGTATDSLADDPEKNVKKLNSAVSDMFKKFPPEEKD